MLYGKKVPEHTKDSYLSEILDVVLADMNDDDLATWFIEDDICKIEIVNDDFVLYCDIPNELFNGRVGSKLLKEGFWKSV